MNPSFIVVIVRVQTAMLTCIDCLLRVFPLNTTEICVTMQTPIEFNKLLFREKSAVSKIPWRRIRKYFCLVIRRLNEFGFMDTIFVLYSLVRTVLGLVQVGR